MDLLILSSCSGVAVHEFGCIMGGGFEKSIFETSSMASFQLLQSQSANKSLLFGTSVGLNPVNGCWVGGTRGTKMLIAMFFKKRKFM